MDLFKLSTDFKTNWEWKVIFKKSHDNKLKLISSFQEGNRITLEEDKSIPMQLINVQGDLNERKEKPFVADLIYWTDDITLGAFKPMSSCCAVVSGELKEVLDGFKLPEHYYYPIAFESSSVDDSPKKYYLLQLIGGLHDIMDYSLSTYEFYDRKSKTILKEEVGAFKNQEELTIASRKAYDEHRIRISVTRIILKLNYDILWGIPSTLYVNEKVMQAVKKHELYGIGFLPLKSPQLILKSELT